MTATTTCQCLINGQWTDVQAERHGDVTNSSTGETIARVPFCSPDDVDRAVQAAQEVFPAWAAMPAHERARIMFRFRDLVERHTDELARLVSREHGKTFFESQASVQRGVEMIEYACGVPALLIGEAVENIATGVDCETIRHPLGVVAGITPFNFPAMVPLWMYPIALVCGNCFILKPSEKVPLSAARLGELLMDAGLPPGVFSIVHGDKECVDAILTHPLIRAASFVGSTSVAEYIYTTGTAHGKRVQAAGGAKNHVIVMPDADMGQAAAALSAAAYGCAGERCMAAALAVPVGDAAEPLVEGLRAKADTLRVGPTDRESDAQMGPVITREHMQHVLQYINIGEQEGAKVVRDGRGVKVPDAPEGYFVGPTVLDHVTPQMRVYKEEIFGPVLGVTRVETIEEAVELGNQCPFGNGGVIFTRSGRAAREFRHRFKAGMIGINISVPAPMAWFSFSGWSRSFFGDLHIQAKEGVLFYTQQKMTMTRWLSGGEDTFQDPVWKPAKPS